MFGRKKPKNKIVVIGAGFAGLAAAKALRGARAEITVIDRQNHHLFQPMLYQVATAGVSPADIAWPIRRLLRGCPNTKVLMAEAHGIDSAAKTVDIGAGRLPYDYLVIATGARHAYFGNDDWERFAPGLKQLDEATAIRRRLLIAFERAEAMAADNERRALLNFVIIGAGPTGVELAGTIAELARFTLARDFRTICSKDARIILIEGNDRVLKSYPPKLSAYAKKALEKLGVEVLLKRRVEGVDSAGVELSGGEKIASRTVLWAAGNAACPLAAAATSKLDSAGRAKVTEYLYTEEADDVFIIGDAAALPDAEGRLVPGVAAAAKQMGKYVGRQIARRVKRPRYRPKPFTYKNWGSMATIGRNAAVADLPFGQMKGRLAWWFWGLVHLYFLAGVRSPIAVAAEWVRSYLTYDRGARLIIGMRREPVRAAEAAAEADKSARR